MGCLLSLGPVSLLHPAPLSPAQSLVCCAEPWDSKGLCLENTALGKLVLGTCFLLNTEGALQSYPSGRSMSISRGGDGKMPLGISHGPLRAER